MASGGFDSKVSGAKYPEMAPNVTFYKICATFRKKLFHKIQLKAKLLTYEVKYLSECNFSIKCFLKLQERSVCYNYYMLGSLRSLTNPWS